MSTQLSASSLPIVTHKNIPVVTSELLAQLYGSDTENIKKNYGRNAERFIEGKHYFKSEGAELREFKRKGTNCPFVKIAKNVRHLMLWTERGAARHAKMLETDQAWEVFEKLEDCYFNREERPSSTLAAYNFNFPLSWWEQYEHILKYNDYAEVSLSAPWRFPVKMLFGFCDDAPSAISALLFNLTQAGYDVSAARLEYLAHRHHAETMYGRLERINEISQRSTLRQR